MVGSPGIPQGPRVLVIAIALAAAVSAAAQAQTPSLPSPTTPSDFASVVGGPGTFAQPTVAQPTVVVPSYYPGDGSTPTATRVEMGVFDTITESLFGDARSEHLAAAAARNVLQRGLGRGLGAVAQRFGRRAPARLDQCHGRQPVPAVVLHVRSGVQQRPEGQCLPRFLHAPGAAEPSPGADHQRPLHGPEQCLERLADPEPEQSERRRRRRATRDSAISRSRPASCCTRRRTSRSRPKWPW